MNQYELWQQAVTWAEQNRADHDNTIVYFESVLGGDYEAYRQWEINYLEDAE